MQTAYVSCHVLSTTGSRLDAESLSLDNPDTSHQWVRMSNPVVIRKGPVKEAFPAAPSIRYSLLQAHGCLRFPYTGGLPPQ
ncbi:hypothetical protein ACRALDRAFT_207189 [Sodiomyces alcalophilus JCM 7366]|uniref:uncharacterized protein n=1 Tax=Sodiomyces alcalophilus JCM 7366 TaxID=591952 RepID=UPI0039B65745